MLNNSYPLEFDLTWIACDQVGHLAAFFTAGLGPIPIKTMNSVSTSGEDLEMMRLMELPQISDANLLVQYKRPDDFIQIAKRGLFVFDWTDAHRTKKEAISAYELIAIPSNRLSVELAPSEVLRSLTIVALDQIVFSQTSALQTQFEVPSIAPEI